MGIYAVCVCVCIKSTSVTLDCRLVYLLAFFLLSLFTEVIIIIIHSTSIVQCPQHHLAQSTLCTKMYTCTYTLSRTSIIISTPHPFPQSTHTIPSTDTHIHTHTHTHIHSIVKLCRTHALAAPVVKHQMTIASFVFVSKLLQTSNCRLKEDASDCMSFNHYLVPSPLGFLLTSLSNIFAAT